MSYTSYRIVTLEIISMKRRGICVPDTHTETDAHACISGLYEASAIATAGYRCFNNYTLADFIS